MSLEYKKFNDIYLEYFNFSSRNFLWTLTSARVAEIDGTLKGVRKASSVDNPYFISFAPMEFVSIFKMTRTSQEIETTRGRSEEGSGWSTLRFVAASSHIKLRGLILLHTEWITDNGWEFDSRFPLRLLHSLVLSVYMRFHFSCNNIHWTVARLLRSSFQFMYLYSRWNLYRESDSISMKMHHSFHVGTGYRCHAVHTHRSHHSMTLLNGTQQPGL